MKRKTIDGIKKAVFIILAVILMPIIWPLVIVLCPNPDANETD